MKRNFYIADTHYGHNNILKYDNRPFMSVEEMDRALIRNWNNAVSPEDRVYILGDFSWYDKKSTGKVLDELNGTKILIIGNHDHVTDKLKDKFAARYDCLEINDGGKTVILSHYPIPFWNKQFYDSVHLYGHVHNSHQWNICEHWADELRQLQALPIKMYNVGCMMDWMGYTPRTLNEIIAGYMEWKENLLRQGYLNKK